MIQILFLIFPIVASILYFLVYKKAGFSGGMLAFCFAPILGTIVPLAGSVGIGLTGMGELSHTMGPGAEMMMVFGFAMIGNLLAMVPLIVLAFAGWPEKPE